MRSAVTGTRWTARSSRTSSTSSWRQSLPHRRQKRIVPLAPNVERNCSQTTWRITSKLITGSGEHPNESPRVLWNAAVNHAACGRETQRPPKRCGDGVRREDLEADLVD